MKRYSTIVGAVLFLTVGILRAADPLPDELSGQDLAVRFENKSTPSGTLKFKGQTYPFTGEFKGDKVVGSFKAGNESYPFTITQDGKSFILDTQGTKYTLTGGAATASGAITLEPQTMRDPASKLDVAGVLVPQGWTLKSDMLWRPKLAQFVSLTSAVFDPKSGSALRWLPCDRFNATPTLFNEARKQGIPLISGGLELSDVVLSPQDYIQRVVLPRYRQIKDLKVVAVEELKDLSKQLEEAKAAELQVAAQNGYEMHYPAARVRVEYPGPGDVTLQEDIYCVLTVTWNPQANANVRNAGFPGTQSFLFYPERLYSFTAPKGQLEAATPLLQTILASTRYTLRWDAYIGNINQMMQRAAIDDHLMEAAAKAEITELQKRTYEERQTSQDKIAEQVGHAMSGTQAFVNPNPALHHIVVPARTRAWVNTVGQVIYSGDSQFDPNKTPNNTATWTQLTKQP